MKVSILVFAAVLGSSAAGAQSMEAVRAQVGHEKVPLLKTLEDLVSIESGSGDLDGIARIGALVAERLRALGGDVVSVPPPVDMIRFETTPPQLGNTVVARFRGTGTKKILLLAHMDTVYQKGMLGQQPFRLDGDRAYGLGIADNKHGVALILHTLETLNALKFHSYGLLTVLVSASEEAASVSTRDLITQLGAEHDVVFSCEGAGQDDSVRLATAGAASAHLQITGRASHAAAPELGRNALYELAYQVLRMRDLSDPSLGTKVNWTLANAGSVSNAIPAYARATADIRVRRVADLDAIEAEIRRRTSEHLIPDTSIDVVFERVFPPMEFKESSLRVAEYLSRIYAEIGGTLNILREAPGGASDAAFASLRTRAPVLEGLGLKGFGSHSNNAEYINVSSVEPRLYLLTRAIIDVSSGKVPLGD